MTNFILIVLAILVSNFITITLGMVIMLNRTVIKKYTKYVLKLSGELSEEIMDEL